MEDVSASAASICTRLACRPWFSEIACVLSCRHFDGKPIGDEHTIARDGSLAGTGALSYDSGNTTGGSDEAAKFKK